MNREQMLARQQEILNAAQAEERNLTPEEQSEFDDLQRQIDALEPDTNPAPGGTQRGLGTENESSQAAQRAVENERSRVAQVTALCREFDMDPTQYINDGSSIEQVRAAVIENMRRTHAPMGARVTQDEGDRFRAAAADGIVLRSGATVEHAAEGAESFRNMDLRALGQECLIRAGEDATRVRGMSSDEVFDALTRQAYGEQVRGGDVPARADNVPAVGNRGLEERLQGV